MKVSIKRGVHLANPLQSGRESRRAPEDGVAWSADADTDFRCVVYVRESGSLITYLYPLVSMSLPFIRVAQPLLFHAAPYRVLRIKLL